MPSRAARTPSLAGLAGIGAAVAAAGVAYASLVELRWFALRTAEVPVLPPGHRPLKVLHLSDLHLTPSQHRKHDWVRGLAELEPDLVVDTGDNLAHPGAIPPLLDALGDLLDVPGVFVFGSNDYFAPTARNPVRYLLPDDGRRATHTPPLPWRELRDAFLDRGWTDLTNRRTKLTVGDTTLAFAGVDDPHLEYDDLASVAGPADPAAHVRVGVAHAPYLRVLDQFARDGYDATLAGHTHGGQLCLPGKGALVTNCDLEPARAKGLHRHPADAAPDAPGSSWLHVSAGLGTSPYAPVRFCCRPEATLLTFTARAGFSEAGTVG
ncbi:MAG TPA: metallophosphoesterase [Nocardioides sp.]|uniref:metallophosphoesterase n=1 Tax=Nocardioides sp. TaxID=35761 RepID=UPI002D80FC0D|nr:metallophosphoesterase [Nocardioides sp.]HET6652185.1 metallophosphoesterase [Nocardioides sp.]